MKPNLNVGDRCWLWTNTLLYVVTIEVVEVHNAPTSTYYRSDLETWRTYGVVGMGANYANDRFHRFVLFKYDDELALLRDTLSIVRQRCEHHLEELNAGGEYFEVVREGLQ